LTRFVTGSLPTGYRVKRGRTPPRAAAVAPARKSSRNTPSLFVATQ
jgi:hypothetical protein